MKKKYYFKGMVFLFNRIIVRNWSGTTCAVSEKKALNNLTYKVKNQMGFLPTSKLILDGQLMEV